MTKTRCMSLASVAVAALICFTAWPAVAQNRISVTLSYAAPGNGPAPNFSPKGTQVALADVSANTVLPEGSTRPAKSGVIKVGTSERSWVPVLVTADPAHPADLCRLFIDRNRNGNFIDDGPPMTAEPSIREKTGDAWTSFSKIELSIPYAHAGAVETTEPYLINVWVVRPKDGPAPDVLRYSVGSWRTGQAKVRGLDAFVAMMDGNNDAIFDAEDTWSVLEASAPDAAKQVLSIKEAQSTKRLMFVAGGPKELVLAFHSVTPDGRTLTFDIVDKPTTKAGDRAGDDTLAAERSRPRAKTAITWLEAQKGFDAAVKQASSSGKRIVLDFWTSWCGPCKTMEEWIWTDADVASAVMAGYVGVRLDGDLEKALVERFKVSGYPTMIVLDASGKELWRAAGYLGSKELLAGLGSK